MKYYMFKHCNIVFAVARRNIRNGAINEEYYNKYTKCSLEAVNNLFPN